MAGLTTHVLDTARGCPASGLRLELYKAGEPRDLITQATTNDDGRCDAPLLGADQLRTGQYEIVFHAGDYLRGLTQSGQLADLPEPLFLDQITIAFGVSDPSAHYHVPLLLSPFGYSTYRGS